MPSTSVSVQGVSNCAAYRPSTLSPFCSANDGVWHCDVHVHTIDDMSTPWILASAMILAIPMLVLWTKLMPSDLIWLTIGVASVCGAESGNVTTPAASQPRSAAAA